MNALPPGFQSPQPDDRGDDAVEATPDRKAAKLNLPKLVSFDSLARCGEELWIENNGEIYRLRRTRQGKLILTK